MDATAWTTWVLMLVVLLSSPMREMAVSAVPVPNPDPEIVSAVCGATASSLPYLVAWLSPIDGSRILRFQRSKRYVVTVPAAAVNLTGVSLSQRSGPLEGKGCASGDRSKN